MPEETVFLPCTTRSPNVWLSERWAGWVIETKVQSGVPTGNSVAPCSVTVIPVTGVLWTIGYGTVVVECYHAQLTNEMCTQS